MSRYQTQPGCVVKRCCRYHEPEATWTATQPWVLHKQQRTRVPDSYRLLCSSDHRRQPEQHVLKHACPRTRPDPHLSCASLSNPARSAALRGLSHTLSHSTPAATHSTPAAASHLCDHCCPLHVYVAHARVLLLLLAVCVPVHLLVGSCQRLHLLRQQPVVALADCTCRLLDDDLPLGALYGGFAGFAGCVEDLGGRRGGVLGVTGG